MKTLLKTLLIAGATTAALVSCTKDNRDYPGYGAYVTVNVAESFYYFTGDDGKTFYPGDVSRTGRYDTEDRDGKRAYIEFNFLTEDREGYDYNIALYSVYNILSKTVEVAENENDVDEAGDGRLRVETVKIRGKWLDITFDLMTDYGIEHKMTLLDNRTVQEAPESMPEGYRYLEFRQKPEGTYERFLGRGHVSYDLGEYLPSAAGTKGLYIRIRNLSGNVEYLTVEYNEPERTASHRGWGPSPVQGLFR